MKSQSELFIQQLIIVLAEDIERLLKETRNYSFFFFFFTIM